MNRMNVTRTVKSNFEKAGIPLAPDLRATAGPLDWKALLIGAISLLLVSGCIGPRPLKGGNASTTRSIAGDVRQTIAQGDNPAQPTRQDQQTVRVRTYVLPQGSRIEDVAVLTTPNGIPVTNHQSTVLSAAVAVTEREESRAETQLGAAQRDAARELGTKLSSMRGITWVGLVMFVFGLASLVWPPLKAVIGSVTTSIAILLGGLALLILPTLIVGNELLILGGVGLVAGAWFLAHRHGQLRGLLTLNRNLNSPSSSDTSTPSPPGPAPVA